MKDVIKKITITTACALLIFIAIYSAPVFRTATAQSVSSPVMLSEQYGRVCNQGLQKVSLYATYENKGLYAVKITIVVNDCATGKELFRIEPESNAGYNPAILLADFTGDGLSEIYLGIDSGGSGAFGYYYIYSLVDGTVNTIFDYAALPDEYTASYADGYKVIVTHKATGEIYKIDISTRPLNYLCEIYNNDGTLREERTADVSAVNTVYPYFSNTAHKYNLLVMRRVTGLYSADALGYTQDFMTFSDGSFTTFFRTFALYPIPPFMPLNA